MNDPITLAATDHEDRHGIPDTAAAPEASDPVEASEAPGVRPIRTLLETAVTCRPIEEVTALVSLLKEDASLPDAGHEALRTAAVTRPVQDVQRMVALLGEPPHETVEADITLRAAAVGRSIEDVALLATILGHEENRVPDRRRDAVAASASASSSAEPEAPAVVYDELYEEPYEPAYAEIYDAPYHQRPGRTAPASVPVAEPAGRSQVLRHVLRWPVAIALLVSGALHLPADLAALPSATPGQWLPLLVTVVCLGLGALLALRDTAAVWRAGAVAALGVVALHVVGGVADFDPLAGAVGGSLAWAGVTAMLCAAAGAVLAGLALRTGQESSA
ncbi:hypothetical protein OG625_01930 [Streptomyces sp. NBC_01351]|uniref:hypothetical protein n=1 Tax=Streptomyces sp. NBC_01351 TaxID=2903833 RepID=UPI002E32FD6E|nr:hypothetical protein [Streptomyces sp. NBC_01351]